MSFRDATGVFHRDVVAALLRLAFLLPAASVPFVRAQNDGVEKEARSRYEAYITRGPAAGALGSLAQVQIPEGYIFFNAEGTGKLLTDMRNIVNGDELGIIGPAGLPWFVVFQYDASGYVRDDEKGGLDADAMLNNL